MLLASLRVLPTTTSTDGVREESSMICYPFDQLLDLLIRDEDRALLNVVEHCTERGEGMVAQLRAAHESDHAWRRTSPEEWRLRIHDVMIQSLVASKICWAASDAAHGDG